MRTVNGVINTITGGRVSLRDGFHIAAAAEDASCFTSGYSQAVAEVLLGGQYNYNVLSMPNTAPVNYSI